MTSRVKSCALVVLVLGIALLLIGASAQSPFNISTYSINLNRKDFETGVQYPSPEFMVTTQVGCNFDDWQTTVAWGDQTENLTHNAQASLPGPATPAGTYQHFSTHSYARAGSYNATASLYVHCVGDPPAHPGQLRDQKSWSTTVYDRLPLQSLNAVPATVKRGGTVAITAKTYADAPLSGTKVDVSTATPNVFSALAMNPIPPHSRTTTASFAILPNATLGHVTITATAGNTLTTTITVVP